MTPVGTPLVEAQALVKVYGGGGALRRRSPEVRAVDGVDLVVREGETLAVVGETGSGKSTLGHLIVGVERPTTGRVIIAGTNLSALHPEELRVMRKTMQLILQNPYSSLNPRMRVSAIISEPLRAHGLCEGPSEKTKRVDKLLHQVGLPGSFARRFPHELSGGQRQRVSIARALAVEPKLLVCDEPLASLDASVQAQILKLLSDLRTLYGMACIFISHDLASVRYIADRVAIMYAGKIVELGDGETVLHEPRHPYTRLLLASVPRLTPRSSDQPSARIIVANSQANRGTGCAFADRCPKAQDICRRCVPPLESNEEADHASACFFPETTSASDKGSGREKRSPGTAPETSAPVTGRSTGR